MSIDGSNGDDGEGIGRHEADGTASTLGVRLGRPERAREIPHRLIVRGRVGGGGVT